MAGWNTTRWSVCASLIACIACNDDSANANPMQDASTSPVDRMDGSVEDAGSEDAAVEDAGTTPGPKVIGGLTIDTKATDQKLDLFGVAGHRFWIEVSDDQRELMNNAQAGFGGGGGWGGPGGIKIDDLPVHAKPAPPPEPGGGMGDIALPGNGGGNGLDAGVDAGWIPTDDGFGNPYLPPGVGEERTHADHVVVQDAVAGSVADYGRIEVKLVGQSTFQPWTTRTIPNLRFDMDEYKKGLLLGDFEHFRLNNNSVGKIFREVLAHGVYRALGYPALRATHAFLGSNVWGEGNWIPMTLIEVYKQKFCEDNQQALGGSCVNMWEFGSDITYLEPNADYCQLKSCNDERLLALSKAVGATPPGPGFKSSLESFIDWDRFHQFQCMSWIMWSTDDAIRGNNTVIVERDDGRFVWLPYSIDISTGLGGAYDVPLYGYTSVATGCQADPECWKDTIATCEDMIEKFDALNPERMADESIASLTKLGMLREGDEARGQSIRSWYAWRQKGLKKELERYREPQNPNCPEGTCPNYDAGVGFPGEGGVDVLDGSVGTPEDDAGVIIKPDPK